MRSKEGRVTDSPFTCIAQLVTNRAQVLGGHSLQGSVALKKSWPGISASWLQVIGPPAALPS